MKWERERNIMRMIKINFWSDYKLKARTQKINLYHHHFCIFAVISVFIYVHYTAMIRHYNSFFSSLYHSYNCLEQFNILIANAKINWGDYNASAITFHLTSLIFPPLSPSSLNFIFQKKSVIIINIAMVVKISALSYQ